MDANGDDFDHYEIHIDVDIQPTQAKISIDLPRGKRPVCMTIPVSSLDDAREKAKSFLHWALYNYKVIV